MPRCPAGGINTVSKRGFFSTAHRYPDSGWIAGVCMGLAEHFDWNVKITRIFALILLFTIGPPIVIAYALLWYLLDTRPGHPSQYADEEEIRAATAAPAAPAGPAAPTMTELKGRFARLEGRLRGM